MCLVENLHTLLLTCLTDISKCQIQTSQTKRQIQMSRASIYAGTKAWVSLCLVDTAAWHCSVASRISLQRHTFNRQTAFLWNSWRDVKAFSRVIYLNSCCVISLHVIFLGLGWPLSKRNLIVWNNTKYTKYHQFLQLFQRLVQSCFQSMKVLMSCIAWTPACPTHQHAVLPGEDYHSHVMVRWAIEHGGYEMNKCLEQSSFANTAYLVWKQTCW